MTDTCINYRFTTVMKSGQGGTINMDFKEEKQFWTTLKFVLKECKMEGRRLAFRENASVGFKYNVEIEAAISTDINKFKI